MKRLDKLNRWPVVTLERANFEMAMSRYAREDERNRMHFDYAVFIASIFLAVSLSLIVATL